MHARKWARLLALCLMAALCLGACGSQTQPSAGNADIVLPEPAKPEPNQILGDASRADLYEITLHYASEDNLSLGTVNRSISVDRHETPIHAILAELLDSASLSGSVEAELLGVESGSGVVTVNLSIEAGVNRSDQDYLQLCASIANTLLEIDGVEAVNVLTGDRSDPLCSLPIGTFTTAQDNIAALYAQVQSESERFPSESGASISRNVLLYFPAQGGEYLLPEVRELSFTAEDYASVIIEALNAGPLMRSCSFSAIPGNLDLLADFPMMHTSDAGERILELSFSPMLNNYLAFAGVESWQLYGSMVLSLCSFVPELDAVRITIEDIPVLECEMNGLTLRFEDGLMRRSDFSAAVGSSAGLYFANGDALCRSETPMARSAASSPLRMLQELISAQPPEGAASVFPQGVRSVDVLGVSVADSIATVNLSANFYARCQPLSLQQERQLVYAMINALCEQGGIGAVSFLVEGRSIDSLAQNIRISTALLPDPGLVKPLAGTGNITVQ